MSDPAELYLDLLARTLTRFAIGERYHPADPPRGTWKSALYRPVRALLDRRRLVVLRDVPFDAGLREVGLDAPAEAETMIGLRRLENIRDCVRAIVVEDVPGDLIECGVWRGGATVFMRAALEAYGDEDRVVWVADSFEGLPKPDGRFEADVGDLHWTRVELTISLDEVRASFERYGLLDERVKFLPGWFAETLPGPIERLALLRIDGDMYGSTHDALSALHPRVSPGGFVIVDDYFSLPAARAATDDYRTANGISAPIEQVDWTACCWRVG